MISVVVPCYNCEKTIRKCVDSILDQTQSEYEIILVDDGATDNTGKICDEYDVNFERVSVVHQKNAGLMAAWKRGVKEARGEYIAFVDSDDFIENSLIEKATQIIQTMTPDIITYGIEVDYSNRRMERRKYPLEERQYLRNEIRQSILPFFFSQGTMESPMILPSRWSKIVKRDLIIKNMPLLNDRFSIGEDDLTSFVIVSDAESIYNIADYYPYHYCRHEGSMMGNYGIETIHKLIDVYHELKKIAAEKNYLYHRQFDCYFLDNLMITIKKIAADKTVTFKIKKEKICEICKVREVRLILEKSLDLSKRYRIKERVFVYLLKNKKISLLCILTQAAAR